MMMMMMVIVEACGTAAACVCYGGAGVLAEKFDLVACFF